MEYMAIVIGVGVVSAIMLYFSFQLNEEEHGLVRLLSIFFALGLLLVIPSSLIESQNVCDVVVNSSTLVSNVTVSYEYTSFCYEETVNAVSTFFKGFVWFIRIFIGYVLIYLIYLAIVYIAKSVRSGKL